MDGVGKFVGMLCAGLAALVALSAYPIIKSYGLDVVLAIAAGAGIALLIISSAFVANSWAFSRSTKDFYRVVMGGMLVRFLFVGVILFVFWKFVPIDFLTFVTSFIGFYLLLHYVEIKYLQKRFVGKKDMAP
jgi:putative flippase GtrA